VNKLASAQDLENLRQRVAVGNKAGVTLSLCSGTGCGANGSKKVYDALIAELAKRGLSKVTIKRTGCHGFCERGPILIVFPCEICYLSVTPERIPEIVSKTVENGLVVEDLVWRDGAKLFARHFEIPFYAHQKRRLLANNTVLDPTDINDYIGCGGYAALARALFSLTPQQVIEEIRKAGLRGRGGGGFPTATKWEATRSATDPVKYVVVNGDEGDPGAYMDRSLLEGNPHSVLEGLLIGAYAVGAAQGYFYIRQEYPLALDNARRAIAQAEERGLLGDNILGSPFSFRVGIHQGAGAFVSGESSALLSAIEGRVGEPRLKYVRMSESGLRGKPTTLNNVETWANVPLIVAKGADWFSSAGTATSTGTKIFSLVGKVRNTGLVEVPMGATLRQIVFDIGGGMQNGKAFKAVQTGGPSGGCIPAAHLDVPVDFDSLTGLGSMMGSGGMIVMDTDSCMVDVARYFVDFLKEESCGKCLPCREGISEMSSILNRIVRGQGKPDDLDFLEDIAVLVSEASLCGLGSSAANPVMSTLRYFRKEYEEHIFQKRCSALACKSLIAFHIDAAKCTGCGLCRKQCPVCAIGGVARSAHRIDLALCIKCGVCLEVCPSKFGAVTKMSPASSLVNLQTQ
jgi:NADH:ubiquinone oxidoreductase subunit F (NADH-binding)/(2Fe-2S) ferredoxin/Pyruvate/2-oxoacid:ferredoxin oxidoreductase delta subunit